MTTDTMEFAGYPVDLRHYYCNRCDYGWTSEHPPYCPYCNGEPTHERVDEEDADND